ncbi:MAG TPA: radical SAM/SPASM family putative metalloenzyme maturase [Geobacteraceae bacterium]|nr:radical SAM/SPASM family putative metalloenzyme maturase [Geobacteraceae bacterium]
MKNGNEASAAPFPWTSERFRRAVAPERIAATGKKSADKAAALPPLLNHPSKLFVELTTRCNLACGMCVKQSPGSGILTGDMSREVFLSLLPAFSKARSLILNGIGEPLLHPELVEFIRIAKTAMPPDGIVGFQTNGILLNDTLAVSLVEAGLDRICLSLDSVCRDTFGKIRSGGDVEDLRKAFCSLSAAQEKNPGSRLRVGVEFVVMRDNLHQLPEVLRWSASLGARFAIVTHLLPYESSQVSQPVFDSNLDSAVELYHSWKRRAETEGIDLSRYFFINFYKFYRTPEEQRIVDFVREMVSDARDKDIFFHVRNLIARDEVMSGEVEKVFKKAKTLAEELGVDLILPALSPRADRRCDFIEDGSAMVSWNGGVHPCYFLWHRYQCHFSYWRKYVPGLESPWGSSTALHFTYWRKSVAAKDFGSVREKGILEIWNDPSFLEFRKEVLRDEYPYCSNCSLVPCDYLTADEFDRDCFDTPVPCGDCFWGLGMFNCLR